MTSRVPRWASAGVARRLTRRYWLQHAAAALATVVCSALLARWTAHPVALGLGTSVGESLVFYGVAFARKGGGAASRRERWRALLCEYGPSEVLDVVLRPTLLSVCIALTPHPTLGAVLGSVLADGAFYGLALGRPGHLPGQRVESGSRLPFWGSGG